MTRLARMVLRTALAMMVSSGLVSPLHAAGDGETLLRERIEQVVAAMRGRRDPGKVFDARFLADVPPAQLRALAKRLEEQGGRIEGWEAFRQEGGAATFTLRLAHASAPARIELGAAPPQLVSGFRIFALTPSGDSLARIDAEFTALPGKAGYAVYRLGGGDPRLVQGREETSSFAVASSFKLYVLAALARQIGEGKRRWSDVIPVSGKSFPGGTLHDFPDGAPVTLHTLASLMISVSDNTATDMLVRLLGQEALAREVALSGHSRPEMLTPMPTTAQVFALKRRGAAETRRYAQADAATRMAILAGLDTYALARMPPGEGLGHGPVAIDEAEWFASPADLAGAMDDLRRQGSAEALAILAINPAMDAVTADEWAYVGYKGGSENGVISMTWLLRSKAGAWSVVTGSWNDTGASLDEKRFEVLMLRLAKLTGN